MSIALLPVFFAVIFAIAAARRHHSDLASAALSAVSAAGAAVAVGVFTDAYFAREFFAGGVPYDAGSNKMFALYRHGDTSAAYVGSVVAGCILTCSVVAGTFTRKTLVGPALTLCILASLAVVGTVGVGLLSLRRAGVVAGSLLTARQHNPHLPLRLETLFSTALLFSAFGFLLATAVFILSLLRVHSTRHTSRIAARLIPLPLAILLLSTLPSLHIDLKQLWSATTYSSYSVGTAK